MTLPSHPLGLLEGFEELQAEESRILNSCENGRCVRVQEGYTCDCFDGWTLPAWPVWVIGGLGQPKA